MTAQRLMDLLERRRVQYETLTHPTTYTAQGTAQTELDNIRDAIDDIAALRGDLGATRNRLQNSINVGLRMVICPEIEADEGDELEVAEGEVRNLATGKSFAVEALPEARQAIIDAGGLIPFARALLLKREARP